MLARLGDVLYWLSWGLVAVLVAMMAYAQATEPNFQPLGAWVRIPAIGRACRYVLSGRVSGDPVNRIPAPRSGQEVDQDRKSPKGCGQIHIDRHVESEGEMLAHFGSPFRLVARRDQLRFRR